MWSLKLCHTLVVLELNIFQKKLENSTELKILQEIFVEQAYDSIVCVYFCIGFIDFMLKLKSLLKFKSLL